MMGLKCGLDEKFFKAFATKMASKRPMERRGMLVLDKIQVRKELAVNSKTMTYSGFIDHGQPDPDCKELADHGLVFAFAPFADDYLQPIAVFASKGPTKGTVLSQLVLQCILKLEEAGVHIDGIVCDGATTNRTMWKNFGISGVLGHVTNSFEHPYDSSRRVFMLSDAPHLFKCIRNRLYSKMFHIGGKFVSWSCYDALYVADVKHAADARVCPKLTYSHINPSNMLKMRVKLATQLFSESVARGLQFYSKREHPVCMTWSQLCTSLCL